MRSIINPKYLDLNEFVLSLPSSLDDLQADSVLCNGRNEVRLYTINRHRVVVKSYRKISLLNRFVYGFLRESKAVRSYYNALHLRQLEIGTPEPIAAIDVKRCGMITTSLYIYTYSEYKDMGTMLDSCSDQELEPLLDALTGFILKIHSKGVLHRDFNIANILCRDCGDGRYDFMLIDINRMDFRPALSEEERLANLRHFNCKPTVLLRILERYAKAMGMDVERAQLHCMGMRWMDTQKNEIKRSFKHTISR